jgi:hypothetical protein
MRCLRIEADPTPHPDALFAECKKPRRRLQEAGDTPFETPATRAPQAEGIGFSGVTASEPISRKPYEPSGAQKVFGKKRFSRPLRTQAQQSRNRPGLLRCARNRINFPGPRSI